MNYKVLISNPAKEDIRVVLKWYKKFVNYKLSELRVALHKKVKSLAEKPERFQIRYNQHRCALIPKFHLQLHYYINDTEKVL